jgi:hypothetical protein
MAKPEHAAGTERENLFVVKTFHSALGNIDSTLFCLDLMLCLEHTGKQRISVQSEFGAGSR